MDFSHLLKRHPLEIEAYFDFVFVLTYAFQKDILSPLLPPGLELDTAGDLAFVAVAIVQTRRMHPKGIPEWIAQDYALVGYRIFVRYKTLAGRNLRGLKILRSDTDSDAMVALGNLLTHYNFHSSKIHFKNSGGILEVSSKAADGIGDFVATADLQASADYLPAGSPFASVRDALKFA